MSQTIDFYFDFSSSYSYIGQQRLRQLADKHGLSIRWKPIALGGIFKELGSTPPSPNSLKGTYVWHDVERSAAECGLPYKWPKPFPFNSIPAARAFYCLAKDDDSQAVKWALAVFDASYGQGRDCSNPAELTAIAADIGVSGEDLLSATTDDAIKQLLITETGAAMERGVFGAPTFFIDDEMYWGADRIDQIDRRLGQSA